MRYKKYPCSVTGEPDGARSNQASRRTSQQSTDTIYRHFGEFGIDSANMGENFIFPHRINPSPIHGAGRDKAKQERYDYIIDHKISNHTEQFSSRDVFICLGHAKDRNISAC